MTIRDHRLTAAAKRWAAAQLHTPPRRRLQRATQQLTRRAKRAGSDSGKGKAKP